MAGTHCIVPLTEMKYQINNSLLSSRIAGLVGNLEVRLVGGDAEQFSPDEVKLIAEVIIRAEDRAAMCTTPMTSARWSGGSRVRFSSTQAFISAASGLSLDSSVSSTAALGLTSVAMSMTRSPGMRLREARGDLSHQATI